MAIQLVIHNAQQSKPISLLNTQQVKVTHGDLIQIQGKANYKLYKKGKDLILKNSQGEAFILNNFYANAEDATKKQVLSWDDEANQPLQASSRDDQDDPSCVPVTEQSSTVEVIGNNTQVISSQDVTDVVICARQLEIIDLTSDVVGPSFSMWAIGAIGAGVAIGTQLLKQDSDGHHSNPEVRTPDQTITINSISNDSGMSAGDFITNDNDGLIINATLSAVLGPGEILQYSNDNGATWSAVLGTNITGIPAVNISFFDVALTTTNTIQFRVSNGTKFGPVVSQLITIDATLPIANTINITSVTDDTGISANDFITYDNRLNINGTINNALGADEYVQISFDGGSTWQNVSSQPAMGTSWSHDHSAILLADGEYDMRVRIVDIAGNLGATDAQILIIDTSSSNDEDSNPDLIINDKVISITGISDDTGTNGSDFVTRDNTLHISGTSDAADGANVAILLDGNMIGYTTVTGGTWTYDHSGTTLADNVYTATAQLIDAAGNVESFDDQAVTVDSQIPVAPASLDLAAVDDNGVSSTDNRTSQTSNLTISGTAEAGGTVQIFNDANNDGVIDVGELLTTVTSATFAVGTDISLAPGSLHHIKAIVTDAAGNVSTASANLDITVVFASGFAIIGEAVDDNSGYALSAAGDVNGDGLTDVIVGAYANDVGGTASGRSYVVFGKLSGTTINLDDVALGVGGFVVTGELAGDQNGYSVSGAGDVNGDGLADLIVGATGNDGGGVDAGRSYVVWGKSDGTEVNLDDVLLGAGGFAITGETIADSSGISVSGAGDVNGDGLEDLIVGASFNDAAGSTAGRSYVIWGKANGTEVNLDNVVLGVGGFAITGEVISDNSGYSVSGAGDVNGDGLADLIVGAALNNAGGSDAGRSYVVWGKSDGTEINLDNVALGAGGFAIRGELANDQSGRSISDAGDVNGDGLADLLVGAWGNDAGGVSAGRSYVVWGKASGVEVDLDNVALGIGGFAITGEAATDFSGYSVSAAGDVNGDGLADVLVGAYQNDAGGSNAGSSYVVFGKADGTAINLDDVALGTGGFAISGKASDWSGYAVSAAGDVNGDGLADLLVGAYQSDVGGSNTGSSYVVWGKTDGSRVYLSDVAAGGVSAHSISFSGTTGVDTWVGTAASEIALGGADNDSLTGGGGADVLYGGEGDDSLIINADNVAKLSLGVTDGFLSRMDGGGGIDTLSLSGGGVTLDLTAIENQSSGTLDIGSRINSIEKINLAGSGNNTLNIDVADVLDMSGMNLFNDASGWVGLGASVAKHQVVVDGNAGDEINLNGTWIAAGTATLGANTYQTFNASGAAAQLLVDTDVALVSHGFVISGELASDLSGIAVASAGDVNGDGLADLIVGAYGNDAGGSGAGRSYIVWGKANGTSVALTDVTSGIGGFAITGELANDQSGYSVSGAGDVNGDGLADVVVGAWQNDAGGANTGRSYVVWGKADGGEVNLDNVALGTGGFAITGELAGDSLGYSVSGAGDVNGDGLADLIVGAHFNDAGGTNSSRAYVVWGKTDGTEINLDNVALGTGGFTITGELANDFAGTSVSSAGDVNGDGLADLIVGAFGNDAGGSSAGRSYVVWGKASGTEVNLDNVVLGVGGFTITGELAGDNSGTSVSDAGDVNGDGLADLVVSSKDNDAAGASAGRSYVVWGKTDGSEVNLDNVTLGVGGFAITGELANDLSGFAVASAGDVNGDGLADLLVGAYGNDAGGANAGRSYVVWGKADGAEVNLDNVAVSIGGFAITGEVAGDSTSVVSAAGDVNGDGLADLIVSSRFSDAAAGRSYVIWGKTDSEEVHLSLVSYGGVSAHDISINGTSGVDSWTGTAASEIALGGADNDSLTGGGGADVLYGGEGDDSLIINADNVAKLSLGVTDDFLSRMDGGGGIDTLILDGAGIHLDFTAIANQSAGALEVGSRVSGIEKINLTGSGNNTLTIDLADVLDMSGMNLFNDASGWVGLGASVARHQFVVDGNAGDSANLQGGWTDTGTTATNGTNTYQIYNASGSAAQILVDTDITTVIV